MLYSGAKEKIEMPEAERYPMRKHGVHLAIKRPSVYLRTFGCQMNTRDSEIVQGLLLDEGYKFVDNEKDADIIIFNTCSVRAHAEHRAVSAMGTLMKRLKKKKMVFGLMGCVAQHKKEELFKHLPGLDFVCGPSDIYEVPSILRQISPGTSRSTFHKEYAKLPKPIIALNHKTRPLKHIDPDFRHDKSHAYVNITYGCDNYCSYCIVPYVRGREVSRPVEDIVKEIESLVERGITHVTLLGQNVNSYVSRQSSAISLQLKTDSFKLKTKMCDFVTLLQIVNAIEGVARISFLTSHPKDANVELFKAMAELGKIEKSLHLPIQSGSNKILKLMNRGYTLEHYQKLVDSYRRHVPDGKLSTDIIVGFPSEQEDDYNQTLKLVKDVKFDSAYIFKYSPRPPALASKMVDDVPEAEKKKRHAELLEIQKNISKVKAGKKSE